MCLIFDVVNPVRKFSRVLTYDESKDDPFAPYDDPNLSETDADPPRAPPHPMPWYQCV